MKRLYFILVVLLSTGSSILAQDGKIIEKKSFTLPDSIKQLIQSRDPDLASKLNTINFYRITYMSDNLKVTGYLAEPRAKGNYPCIISNRGGNRDLGQWNMLSIAFFLGRMADWGYVVIASQYRGNDGGEGKEEFGGKDVSDVLNLIPALSQFPNADTTKIGIEGSSRGGTMVYQALKRTARFKAAVVTSGVTNFFTSIATRPEMEKGVYAELIPNYWTDKEEQLKARSAVFWADKMSKTTPILIMHGSSDWRVSPDEAFELVKKLHEHKHPTRFILFEGADHGIREFKNEAFAETKRHFDFYLRDEKKYPSMEPHGR